MNCSLHSTKCFLSTMTSELDETDITIAQQLLKYLNVSKVVYDYWNID